MSVLSNQVENVEKYDFFTEKKQKVQEMNLNPYKPKTCVGGVMAATPLELFVEQAPWGCPTCSRREHVFDLRKYIKISQTTLFF